MATYNGEMFIKEQLSSILLQLSDGDEVVVSDDGSSDHTLDVVASFGDSRVKVVLNNGPHGVVPNFENALRATTGDVVFLADQDDVWPDNKVKVCLEALNGADLVVHDLKFMDADGNLSDNGFFESRHSKSGFWRNLYKNGFMGSCMAFKKEVKEYALPFPKGILWHDMWIGLMAECKGKTLFIPQQLLWYRRHGLNASPTGEHSSFPFSKQLQYRWRMFYNAIFRFVSKVF